MNKFVVIAKKNNSSLSSVTKEFSTDGDELNKFIELKTRAGYTCNKFEFTASYTQESQIVSSTTNLTN